MSCRTCAYFEAEEPQSTEPQDVRSTIRAALAAHPHGLTSEELADAAGLNENTVRGRLSELERAGVVRRRRRAHRTDSGRRARLYVLAVVPALVAGGSLEGGRP
jgi:predicted ArsR family transcriptional regulator